jgi:hypothetical protein
VARSRSVSWKSRLSDRWHGLAFAPLEGTKPGDVVRRQPAA